MMEDGNMSTKARGHVFSSGMINRTCSALSTIRKGVNFVRALSSEETHPMSAIRKGVFVRAFRNFIEGLGGFFELGWCNKHLEM